MKINEKKGTRGGIEVIRQLFKVLVIMVLIALGLFLNYSGYKMISSSTTYETKCGVVTAGLEKNRTYKSQVHRDLYMGVQFDNGTFQAMDVSPTTYMSKKVGDRVCFDSKVESNESVYVIGAGALGCVVIFLEVCFLLIWFLSWVFKFKL